MDERRLRTHVSWVWDRVRWEDEKATDTPVGAAVRRFFPLVGLGFGGLWLGLGRFGGLSWLASTLIGFVFGAGVCAVFYLRHEWHGDGHRVDEGDRKPRRPPSPTILSGVVSK